MAQRRSWKSSFDCAGVLVFREKGWKKMNTWGYHIKSVLINYITMTLTGLESMHLRSV